MSIWNLLRAGLLSGALVFAACGGTPAGPGATPAQPQQPGQTPAGPADTPAQPAQPAQPGAGHDLQDPCGLATVEEVSQALGVTAVQAEENVGGDTTYCNYRDADGRSLLATSFSQADTNQMVFNSFAGADDAVPVPGVGDNAVVSGGALYVLAGNSMVGIQPNLNALEDVDEQQLVQILSQLGQMVAGRL